MKITTKGKPEFSTKVKRRSEWKQFVETTETAMLFQAFEENLFGLMRNFHNLRNGREMDDWAVEALTMRYLEAKEMLRMMSDKIDGFETMMMVIENDLLEGPGTSSKEVS